MAGVGVFEARYSPARSAMLGLLSFGFVALGLWLVGVIGEAPTDSRRVPDWMIPIVGWICIAFFGSIGFLHLFRASSPGVSVRVDQHGLFIRDFSQEAIPWSDFTELGSQNLPGTSMLVFDVVPERRETFGLFRRLSWPLNTSMYGKGGPAGD